MASIESLAADQRAVLQLVLGQGRSYDEIGGLLSIDRSAVRERALEALDVLGPRTPLRPERRALITDYLLGQLPARVSADVGARLAVVADEREWAGAIASALAPLASRPLPEIPAPESAPGATIAPPGAAGEPSGPVIAPPGAAVRTPDAEIPEPVRVRPPPPSGEPTRATPAMVPGSADQAPRPAHAGRGGTILVALGALVAVVGVVVIIIVISGGGHGSAVHTPSRVPTPTTSSVASTPAAPARRVISRFKLVSPTGGARPVGVGEVLQIGSKYGIAIVARGVPANGRHNAYGVWLYNSPSDNRFLGFDSRSVGVNGDLTIGNLLRLNPAPYKQLLVTLETVQNPHAPGRAILHGALRAP